MDKTFRISVNLNNYFNDHRGSAKIFISKHVKRIQDVENRVREIFKIDNFHFVSGEYYLPPSEDVRVLQMDEVICAVPNTSQDTICDKDFVTKKRKKKIKESITDNDQCEKAKKKKTQSECCISMDFAEEIDKQNREEVEDDKNSSKKRKKKKIEILDNVNNANEQFISQENSNTTCSPPSFKCKGDFPYYRKRINLPTSTDEYLKNKKINIVKIEHIRTNGHVQNNDSLASSSNVLSSQISDLNKSEKPAITLSKDVEMKEVEVKKTPPSDFNSLNPSVLNTPSVLEISSSNNSVFREHFLEIPPVVCTLHNVDLPKISVSSQVAVSLEETVNQPDSNSTANNDSLLSGRKFSRKNISGLGHLLQQLKGSSEADDSNNSIDLSQTKPSRKRVRKRKRKSPAFSLDSSIENQPKPVYRQATLGSVQNTHIKFNEDGSDANSPSEECHVNGSVHYEEPVIIDNITINDSFENEGIQFNEEFMMNEENVLKQPLMVDIFPKEGDIIAFKILRVTEDYTPQVSDYITGKVLKSNPQNKEIDFNILYGLSQCLTPNGKLSLNNEENTESRVRMYLWSDVLYPRLLYP